MDGIPHTPGQQPGVELRRLRQARGWSLAEMAREVPYSKSYLSKLETGTKRITLDIARCVDEAMGTDGALAAVVCAIDGGALPADDEPAGSEACPYPGLAAFGPDQARWFFGRGDTTRDLISQLDNPLTRGELVAVVAASGAGKSSVLAAGLIPNLARGALPGSRTWPVVLTTPGEHPLSTLAAKVATATNTDPAGVAHDPDRFAAFLADAVTTHSGEPETTPHHARIVLIVDQFEETFTECHQEAERQLFIATLDAVAASAAALVVLGVRADFYGRCLSHPALRTALQRPVTLGPMSVDQLRAVITCPAEAEGLNLEPGLVELMLRDLGVADDMGSGPAGYDPGTLPLLAHALRATWRQRDGRTLTVEAYRRTGGISQALATTAEDTHAGLSAAEQHIARQLLLRLVNVSEHGGSGDTRRRLSRAELIEALPPQQSTQVVEKVLEAFGRARLITFDTTNVEITHEALIRAWPRLQAWIDTGRAGNVIRQELSEPPWCGIGIAAIPLGCTGEAVWKRPAPGPPRPRMRMICLLRRPRFSPRPLDTSTALRRCAALCSWCCPCSPWSPPGQRPSPSTKAPPPNKNATPPSLTRSPLKRTGYAALTCPWRLSSTSPPTACDRRARTSTQR